MQLGERALITCITKQSAEALSEFLTAHGVPSCCLHSGATPAQRVQSLESLRAGDVQAIVGCNLLREGLDLPEVSLVCVMNADKQGFLRSS